MKSKQTIQEQKLTAEIEEVLAKFGNYKTVKKDWENFEGSEQFEIVSGNKIMMDTATQALLTIFKDYVEQIIPPKENNYMYQNKEWVAGYNQAIDDMTKKLEEML